MRNPILCTTHLAGAMAMLGLAIPPQASAQSQVTVYGLVDTGIVHTTNTNSAGQSNFKIPATTGSLPSRIGVRGNEDLGGGLQAVFVLENGFGLDTGMAAQGGRLFGRQAYVGLKGNWGTLMLGRQSNMTFLADGKIELVAANIFSLSSLDPYLPNARSDNAIGYLGSFSGFTVGATYSLGRDTATSGGPAATSCAGEVPGNAKACRQMTALLAYDGAGFGALASYDILYGHTGAANGLTSSGRSDQRIILGGHVVAGTGKITGGMVHRTNRPAGGKVRSDLWFVSASFPLNPLLVLDGELARLNMKGSPNDTVLVMARMTYHLSRRTALYASAGHIDNAGNAAIAIDSGGTTGVGNSQNGVMLGVRHAF